VFQKWLGLQMAELNRSGIIGYKLSELYRIFILRNRVKFLESGRNSIFQTPQNSRFEFVVREINKNSLCVVLKKLIGSLPRVKSW
jgi:hypothetical protein